MKAHVNEKNKIHAFEPTLQMSIEHSWKKIATYWPLPNLIAANPLQGLESLPFEAALEEAFLHFQQPALTDEMASVNRESIKWLQAYFDRGQATLVMPYREQGLFSAWKRNAIHDDKLTQSNPAKLALIKALPNSAKDAIFEVISQWGIPVQEHERLLTFLLTTLPGWSAYVKYCAKEKPSLLDDYLAFRLAIASLCLPNGDVSKLYKTQVTSSITPKNNHEKILAHESAYKRDLVRLLSGQKSTEKPAPAAQFVFCIDVRSEPFRRALESTGNYDTFGFAGFFGVPVKVCNQDTDTSYNACPVLLTPEHTITAPCRGKKTKSTLVKKIFQSLKYSLVTPFALVECIGMSFGVWMFGKTFFHPTIAKMKTHLDTTSYDFSADSIDLKTQINYAETLLRAIGLTDHFAPKVILCGHKSTTENNAYGSAYDCGACGGNRGAPNACLCANILNNPEVRLALAERGITIPAVTQFIAAEHDTTTDELVLFTNATSGDITKLQADLTRAQSINLQSRHQKLNPKPRRYRKKKALSPSTDWSETRPEWGLAGNASFIVAPRSFTRAVNLDGRAFLHSYDPDNDADGLYLKSILTAPMVVAQWINAQYLFSSLDNVAFGSGSKITKNIVGKIGFMQGNASDLLHGLPLQSVNASDSVSYHEPIRLITLIVAPLDRILSVIKSDATLTTYASNGWVHFMAVDPTSDQFMALNTDLTWTLFQG